MNGTDPAASPSGGAILVVDDNELNRDLLSRRLRRDGHVVTVAEHGRVALDLLAQAPFDLVLLDIMMPDLTGYDVLAMMKADESLRHIPVVMITAATEEESIVRCLSLGADDHLPKPFNPAILRARVGSSLAKKRLQDTERLYAQSLARELDIGRQIQAGFLPDVLPARAGYALHAHFRPARQVAGDFYDAFDLPDGRIALVLADVCGKGVGAALFMALFRSLLRALAEPQFTAASSTADGLYATVRATNDYIACTHGRANMFATVFFAVLDPSSGSLDYINAGHELPVVIGADGRVRARLGTTGPAVGLLPDVEFRVSRDTLAPGETMFAFTDGVGDARDSVDGAFGEERLLDLLAAGVESPTELIARIDAALTHHIADTPQFDDVAMLAIQREEGRLHGDIGREWRVGPSPGERTPPRRDSARRVATGSRRLGHARRAQSESATGLDLVDRAGQHGRVEPRQRARRCGVSHEAGEPRRVTECAGRRGRTGRPRATSRFRLAMRRTAHQSTEQS